MAKTVPRTKAGKTAKMSKVMHEWGEGKLHSGSKKGPLVKDQKQAVAIGLKQSGQSKGKRLSKTLERRVEEGHDKAKR